MLCADANLLLIGTGMLDDDGVRDLQQRVNVVTVGYCVHRQVCRVLLAMALGKGWTWLFLEVSQCKKGSKKSARLHKYAIKCSDSFPCWAGIGIL